MQNDEPVTNEALARLVANLDAKLDKRLDAIEATLAEHGRLLHEHGVKLDQLLDGGVDMASRHVDSDDRMLARLEVVEQTLLKHLGQAAA